MKRIMSKEPVVVPNEAGGVRERFLVEVPALEDEATGEIFLEDEALETLDREKEEAMARYAAKDFLQGLLSSSRYAGRLAGFPTRRHLTIRVAFGAGESPTVEMSSFRELSRA